MISNLHVLDIAAMAVRDGWHVEVEAELPTARRPDLRLTRDGTVLWVEATRSGPDKQRHEVERFTHHLRENLWVIERKHEVVLTSRADSVELDGAAFDEFMRRLDVTAAKVASIGRGRIEVGQGLTVEVGPAGSGQSVLDGPALSGDMWERLERRIVEKVKQTRGAEEAWISIDEASNLFQLTDLNSVDEDEQLFRVAHNIGLGAWVGNCYLGGFGRFALRSKV